MIIKPSITFLITDSDARLVVHTNSILTAMADNPSYGSPYPTLTTVTSVLSDFTTALANAADGGMTLTAIKNANRAELVGVTRDLASYVQVACKGNLSVLRSSGFPIQKTQRTRVGKLPAPVNLTVTLGDLSGELDAVMQPVFGAATYNWRVCAASAPTVVVQTAQSTGARNSFTGLTPGVNYIVQANAVGTAGPGDWSNPVTQMVI